MIRDRIFMLFRELILWVLILYFRVFFFIRVWCGFLNNFMFDGIKNFGFVVRVVYI